MFGRVSILNEEGIIKSTMYIEEKKAMVSTLSPKDLWEHILTQVELLISPANFNTWFKKSFILKVEGGVVFVAVPSLFFKEWYLKKFHFIILKIVRSVSYEFRNVEYVIIKEKSKQVININKKHTTTLPLNDFYVDKNDNLNPRYTFDSFVVGPFNEMAYAAAQAVINKPGITYNPLFIYGDTGRGKTHLIQAVGNQFKKIYLNRKVFYLTSEKFTVEYINSIQNGTANRFKERYRQYDLLIMDDIQFLSRKEKSQEELFHLFNTLYDTNKQIIFSSDKPPSAIPDIADRLRSRFSAGMMIDIGEPDTESRIMIINKKLALNSLSLDANIVEYIATTIPGSIREIEGVINTIVCYTQTKGSILDLLEVRQLLRSFSKSNKTISTKQVISKVCDYYNMEKDAVYRKTRRREIVRPRQIIMYILREDFNVSYTSIGIELGGRDHTTVIHSCDKIKKDLEKDVYLMKELEDIRSLFK